MPELPLEPQPKDVKPTARTILDLDGGEFIKFQYLENRHAMSVKSRNEIMKSIQDIDSYIMGSINFDNELWTLNVDSTWALLRALQKRLAPTDHSVKVDVINSYNALKKYNKNQSVDRFLYEWERVYGLATTINLPDVFEERPLYDFALALEEIDQSYAINLELRIDENVRLRSIDNSIKPIELENAIEEFRNYYNRHQASRQISIPTSFATTHNGVKPIYKACVCGSNHMFKECYYLNPDLRPSGWIGKEATYHEINRALADPRRIKIKTLIEKTLRYDGGLKGTGATVNYQSLRQPSSNAIDHEQDTEELQNSFRNDHMNFATLTATDSAHTLKDSWILDGGSDIHICNDATKWGFQTVKQARNNVIRAGNSTIPIEAYGNVKVKVDTPSGKRHITLYNVGLAQGFLTNIVSMQLLNQCGFHWNSRIPTRLECEDGSLACTLYQDGGHILFNNLNIQYTALITQSAYDPRLRTLTEATLHQIMSHASPEVISNINGPDHGINIDKSDPAPKTSKCVPCSLAKSKNIISRKSGSEIPRSGQPFHTLCWDAMVLEEAYNGDRYVSHFYCPDSHFNFIFPCRSKTNFKQSLQTVIQLIKTQWQRNIHVFRLDGETSLIQECKTLVREHGILCQISAAYTPEQNGSAERSGGVIMTKARAMGLEASLPTNLWPETVVTAGYIANRTPIRQLRWKTPFEVVHGVKPSYAHLHVFGCRAYAFDKHVPKSKKLNSRAHLGHLVGYDSTNIFKVWIPSKQKCDGLKVEFYSSCTQSYVQ